MVRSAGVVPRRPSGPVAARMVRRTMSMTRMGLVTMHAMDPGVHLRARHHAFGTGPISVDQVPRVDARITYSWEPSLRDPRRFLGDAVRDVRRALPLAGTLTLASLRSRHRGSVLGYLWLVLPTIGTAL